MSRILMVTPMLKSQRGNSITAARIYNGLKGRGYNIDLLSLDEPDWQEKLDRCKDNGSYALVHGFHTLHFAAAAGHGAIKNLPLLLTEGVELVFTDDAIEALATHAHKVNQSTQNIGARRLYTILERLLEELSFEAPEINPSRVVVNAAYVNERLQRFTEDEDLSKYIL